MGGTHLTAAILLLWPIMIVYVLGLPIMTAIRGFVVRTLSRDPAVRLPSDAMRFNLFLVRDGLRFLFAGLTSSRAPIGTVPFITVLAVSAISVFIRHSPSTELVGTAAVV